MKKVLERAGQTPEAAVSQGRLTDSREDGQNDQNTVEGAKYSENPYTEDQNEDEITSYKGSGDRDSGLDYKQCQAKIGAMRDAYQKLSNRVAQTREDNLSYFHQEFKNIYRKNQ